MNRVSILSRTLRPFTKSDFSSTPIIPHIQSRFISSTSKLYNSPFGKLTTIQDQQQPQPDQEQTKQNRPEIKKTEDGEVDISSINPRNDEQLIDYHKQQQLNQKDTIEKLIHPLKIKLFNQVVSENGFFKNNQIIKNDKNQYIKFTLTNEEIDILEPSILLQSYRIKSSMKKATLVNRFVRGMDLKTAINQLHFNPKKMSTELEKLLKEGLIAAKNLNYNENGLYIARLWTGSDGKWRKRLDIKGRGRHGIIRHSYIHLKCVLKTDQTTKRLQWEKLEKERLSKPKMYLNNEPLNIKVRPWYKW
ncbi:mrpl22 [Candida jiufengensis]|uniref:mrpl22 n=1 Tax=Candida jiufengensis TaxID=497108 RepID=UPI0022252F5E|nr:mrpl22 [Candida jiufengensis]KAI5955239.1 mrpl22 [Candida jiufengensis]